MEILPALLLLLVATALAATAGSVMAHGDEASPGPDRDRSVREEGDAVTGLAVACLAVAAGTTGAARLSSGELSISGVGPFLLAVVVVLFPLAVAARRARHRAGHR